MNLPALQNYIALYESMTPDSLDRLERYFSPEVRFKDPFNDVIGVDAIRGIFEHMYHTLDQPEFSVNTQAMSGATAFLLWEFRFRLRSRNYAFTGTSVVDFDEAGKVVSHIDYWDPAEHIYSHIPVLGRVLKFLKKRLSADS